jgi:hypothetical protein
MPLNTEALARSLNSIIELGNKELWIENIREYVVLYNETLRYIKEHLSESDVLQELYGKFPEIEYREFNTPADKVLTFFNWILQIGGRRRLYTQTFNPRLNQYRHEILEAMPLISTIASEMMMRLGK